MEKFTVTYEGGTSRYSPESTELAKARIPNWEEWFRNGRSHRIGGPARVVRASNGSMLSEEWRVAGELHRVGGPALIERTLDGAKVREEFATHSTLDKAKPASRTR
jgi:hypothetical protein